VTTPFVPSPAHHVSAALIVVSMLCLFAALALGLLGVAMPRSPVGGMLSGLATPMAVAWGVLLGLGIVVRVAANSEVPAPPAAPAGPTLPHDTVCTRCFTRFPAGTLSAAWPTCADCTSEGMELEVAALDAFLDAHTLADLDALAARWDAAEGMRPAYKAYKAANIAALRALKAASTPPP
jgi:hypothetical protein